MRVAGLRVTRQTNQFQQKRRGLGGAWIFSSNPPKGLCSSNCDTNCNIYLTLLYVKDNLVRNRCCAQILNTRTSGESFRLERCAMRLTADQDKKLWYEVTGDQSGTERIRQRLCEMSDAELLRFGMVAKYMCSQEANPEQT